MEYYIIFLLLSKYSCLHFPATTFPCHTHTHLPPSILTPFGFVHGCFIHVPWWPFPFFPPFPPFPSGYCQFVFYFRISGYILLACLFCWLGSYNFLYKCSIPLDILLSIYFLIINCFMHYIISMLCHHHYKDSHLCTIQYLSATYCLPGTGWKSVT